MSRFILAIVLVLNVPSLAEVQTLVADPGPATVSRREHQLVDEDQRVGRDHQSVARSTARRAAQTARAYAAAKTPSKTPQQAVADPKPETNGGWIKCPCGDNCTCALEQICKNGDCKKNYVVLVTQKWCRACPRMKIVADQLHKDGYIVYVVDFDEAGDKIAPLKITHLPTTLVFDESKEVKRFVGIASIDEIKDGLKTKTEQLVTVPDAPQPYNFR